MPRNKTAAPGSDPAFYVLVPGSGGTVSHPPTACRLFDSHSHPKLWKGFCSYKVTLTPDKASLSRLFINTDLISCWYFSKV